MHRACAYHGHIQQEEDPDEFAERLKIVKLLIDNGADLNAITRVRNLGFLRRSIVLNRRFLTPLVPCCPCRLNPRRYMNARSTTSKRRPICFLPAAANSMRPMR